MLKYYFRCIGLKLISPVFFYLLENFKFEIMLLLDRALEIQLLWV